MEYYALHFQIEFEFRDAKQHFGLSDFVWGGGDLRPERRGSFVFHGQSELPEAGVVDLKSYYRGRRYALETLKHLPAALKCLAEFADGIVCSGVLTQMDWILDQVCRLGLIHPGGKVASVDAKVAKLELCT